MSALPIDPVEVLPGERLLPFATACEKAFGKRPSPSSSWRQRQQGWPFVVGPSNRPLTSVEALLRYAQAKAAKATSKSTSVRSNSQRERAVERAEAELASIGI